MAKNNDDFDLEDFDLDDFDFDIPDFDGDIDKPDDRKPVTKLASGFFEGATKGVANTDTLKRVMRLSLPKGYSQALNVADTVGESTRELYNSALTELRPLTDTIRRTADKIVPKIKGKLPNFLAQKLEGLSFGEDAKPGATPEKLKEDAQNTEIANAMAELFKAQGEAQTEQQARTEADTLMRDQIQSEQHKTSLGQLNIIAKGVSRLAGYQDQILSKYQQKSLELQYRQYFVSKELLDVTNVQNEKLVAAVEKIIYNTALPEAVKIQKSEMADMMIKQRLVAGSLNTLSNWTSSYRQKLTDNLKGLISGALAPLGMLSGFSGEGMGDTTTNVGYGLGSEASGAVIDYLAQMASPYLAQNDTLRRGSNFLSRNLTGIPQRLDRFAKSETRGYGFMSNIIQGIKDMMPKYYLNDQVGGNQLMAADQPAIWDRQSHRTLNEIIPGYLAQINRWTKASATGQLDEEVQSYNLVRGGFTSDKTYRTDIQRQILTPQENRSLRDTIDQYIAEFDKDGEKLTPDDRLALRRLIVSDVAKGGGFDAKRFTQRQTYGEMDDDQADRLRYFFRNEFGLDADGNREDASLDTEDRLVEAQEGYGRLASLIPAVGDRIRAFVDVVGIDRLRKLGFVSRVGGTDRIDHEKIWDLIMNDAEVRGLKEIRPADEEEDGKPTIKGLGLIRGAMTRKKKEEVDTGTFEEEADTEGTLALQPRPAAGYVPPMAQPLPLPASVDANIDMDPYLGKDSLLIRELREIKQRVQDNRTVDQQNEILAAMGHQTAAMASIHEYLQVRDQGRGEMFVGPPRPGGGGGQGLLRQALGYGRQGLTWAGKKYAQGVATFYKGAGRLGLWTADKGFDLSRASFNRLFQQGKEKFDETLGAVDLYVRGRLDGMPALRGELLKAGEYVDALTGKVIKNWSDITGPIKDKAGKYVITAEEYARGIYNTRGESVMGKFTRMATDFGGKALSFAAKPYQMGFDFIRWMKDQAVDAYKGLHDAYVKGELKPRLRQTLLDAGEYFDSEGKVIQKWSDIKGDVKDRWGKVLVTAEELQQSGGLWSQTGERIRDVKVNVIRGAIDVFNRGKQMAFDVASWAGRTLRQGARGIASLFRRGKARATQSFSFTGDADNDLVNLNFHQLGTLERIYELLDNKFNKRVKGDVSGNGLRDNSWAEIQERRQKRLAEQAEQKAEAARRVNPLAGLAGLFGKKKDEEEDEEDDDSLIDKAKDWKDTAEEGKDVLDTIMGDDDEEEPDKRRRGRRGRRGKTPPKKKQGLLRRGLGAVGSGAWWLTKKTGGAAWWLASRAAWPLARFAATALAGIVSTPVVLTAAAVAGAGYAGYKIYQHYANAPAPVRGMRHAQYGIDVRNAEQVGKIVQLEETIMPYVSYPEGDAAVIGKGIRPDQVLSIFGLDRTADQERLVNWMNWFGRRFQPVFLAHLTALNRMAKGIKLQDVDDKLPVEMGEGYVQAARLDTLVEIYDDTQTSPFDHDLSSDADDVEGWINDALKHYRQAAAEAKERILKEEGGKQRIEDLQRGAAAAGTAAAVANLGLTKGLSPVRRDGFWASMAKGITNSGIYKALTSRTAAMVVAGPIGVWLYDKIVGEKPVPMFEIKNDSVDTAMSARYRIYGLNELEASKVNNLLALEEYIWPYIQYNPDKSAYFTGKATEAFTKFATQFGVANSDQTQQQDWFLWFRFRFMPALLKYAGAVRAVMAIDAREAPTRLKPEQMRHVLVQMSEATCVFEDQRIPVWEVNASPWPEYELNTTPDTIEKALASLKSKETQKDKVYSEEYINLIVPKPAAPPSANTPGVTNFANLPSPSAEYLTGKTTAGAGRGIMQRMQDSFDKTKQGATPPLMTQGAPGGAGAVAIHPGGGTGGDINQIPNPQGSGWGAVRETIIAAANMAGVDPAVAATMAAIESEFKPGVRNPLPGQTATGLYQFISGTWKEMLENYGPKYGIAPGTPPTDARANALMGMEYIKENAGKISEKFKRPATDRDLYLMHLLGGGGGVRLLRAPPNDLAINHVGPGVAANNAIFFYRNARARTGPLTVSEAMAMVDKRMGDGRKMHDLQSGQQYASTTTPPPNPTAAPAVAEGGAQPPVPGDIADPEAAGESATVATDYASGGFTPVAAPTPAPGGASAPAVPMGSRGATAMAAGLSVLPASAPVAQPTPVSGLTAPRSVPEVNLPTPQQQALIAQRQASAENGSMLESMNTMAGILTDQLQTQRDILGVLKAIQAGGGSLQPVQQSRGDVVAAAPTAPSLPPGIAAPSGRAPVSVKRTG